MRAIIIGLVLFVFGQIFAWYQFNSQFVWEWAKKSPILSVLVFGIPMGLCFIYGTRYIYSTTNQLWTVRFMGFGVSVVAFTVLTYLHMQESPFTFKTIISFFLSMLIIGIQLFYK